MSKALLRFDGGCRGNPGAMYGSYRIIIDGNFELSESRFELGHGTNNEAEWESLLKALKSMCIMPGNLTKMLTVQIITDSMVVKARLSGNNKIHSKAAWKDRSTVMFNYANQCLELLKRFGGFTIEWQPRQENVEAFGH